MTLRGEAPSRFELAARMNVLREMSQALIESLLWLKRVILHLETSDKLLEVWGTECAPKVRRS